MARYDFTNEQLILVSMMNRNQLASWLNKLLGSAGKRRGEGTMDIIHGLQRALSTYSKRVGKFDRVQDKMLAILGKLEKWLRLDFVKNHTPDIIRCYPKLALNPEAVKRKVLADWENYFKRRSY